MSVYFLNEIMSISIIVSQTKADVFIAVILMRSRSFLLITICCIYVAFYLQKRWGK